MRLSRRGFMAGVAAGAIASALPAHSAEGTRRPNIIFAFSDEHRWHSMGCTEMPELQTPNLCGLAGGGVSFTNCISNAPVCSPYRGMLMTGQWPFQQGVTDNGLPLSPEKNLLGHTFKSAGYKTGYIGKWHLGGVRAEPHGFDESLIWTEDNTHWDKSQYHPGTGDPVRPKGYNATLMTDQALSFIKRNVSAGPFLLMLSWNPPHSNFTDAPAPKKALYPKGSLSRRKNVPDDVRGDDSEGGDIWQKNGWPNYQGYHAHISAIDDEMGRLLACLDELGLAKDTIVVYSSDHGSMMGSHGLGGKRQPYEESIRVPFIVRWPEHVPAGRKTDALFGVPDVFPTLCGLAGLTVPSQCFGRDYTPEILGTGRVECDAQLIVHISKTNASGGENHPAPLFRGLRTPRHTFTVRADGPWLLYDNQADPFQLDNRVKDESLKTVRAELEELLRRKLKEAADPFTWESKA